MAVQISDARLPVDLEALRCETDDLRIEAKERQALQVMITASHLASSAWPAGVKVAQAA